MAGIVAASHLELSTVPAEMWFLCFVVLVCFNVFVFNGDGWLENNVMHLSLQVQNHISASVHEISPE
jgi:hypothetical protein